MISRIVERRRRCWERRPTFQIWQPIALGRVPSYRAGGLSGLVLVLALIGSGTTAAREPPHSASSPPRMVPRRTAYASKPYPQSSCLTTSPADRGYRVLSCSGSTAYPSGGGNS